MKIIMNINGYFFMFGRVAQLYQNHIISPMTRAGAGGSLWIILIIIISLELLNLLRKGDKKCYLPVVVQYNNKNNIE